MMEERAPRSSIANPKPGEAFWELYRKLGECYEAEINQLRKGSSVTIRRTPSSGMDDCRLSSNAQTDGSERSSDPVGVAKSLAERRQSVQIDLARRPSQAGSEISDSTPRSQRPRDSRANTSTSKRASSARSLHNLRIPSRDAILPVPPLGPPTVLDSPPSPPTRNDSAMSSEARVLQASLTKGSETFCAEDLVPRPTWMKTGLKTVPKTLAKKATMMSAEELTDTSPYASEQEEEKVVQRVFHPGGRARTVWDVLAVIWLLYDIIFIPLQFFDLPQSPYFVALAWATIAFWSIDILMSFRTGVYIKGVLVMDSHVVALTYMRTWLFVDIILVSLDWTSLTLESIHGDQGGHNVLWILRLLRLVRVVRIGKMSRTAMVIQETMQVWAVSVQFSVAMNIVRLLLMNHMIACAWWGFGHFAGTAEGWTLEYDVEDKGLVYGYATSLHWAIAQLGVGSTEVEATNAGERIFSIFVALLALITFSTMVSSMTSMMTSYYRSKEEEIRHFALLQRFLLHNCIPVDLSERITKFLQHAYMAQFKASSQDMHVPLLEMLSRPLMNELQLEKHRSQMLDLPFLGAILNWQNVQTLDAMRNLASSSLTVTTVATKDVIFSCGVEAVTAYLPISGAVCYMQEGRPPQECLGVWTAEMCLWTEWYFLGDFIATEVSRILMLDMSIFCETIASHPLTHGLAVQYAKEYTRLLQGEAMSEEISDTWQLGTEPEVHDLMAGHGFAPELVFNTFGRRNKGKTPSHVGGLAALPGLARIKVVPDQILE